MSTDNNVFDLLAHALKPSGVRLPRPVRVEPAVRTYSAILVRDDVTIGELMHALRFSDIVVTTDPASGQTIIRRSPKSAA